MSGKGSKRRPTDELAYSDGWDRIYGVRQVHGHEAQDSQEDGTGQVQQDARQGVPTEARG